MKELFKFQLENNAPITSDILEKMTNKVYHSGRDIMVNDIILSAFLLENPDILETKVNYLELSDIPEVEAKMTLIFLNEKDFDLYDNVNDLNRNITSDSIPVVKKKDIRN